MGNSFIKSMNTESRIIAKAFASAFTPVQNPNNRFLAPARVPSGSFKATTTASLGGGFPAAGFRAGLRSSAL